MTDIEQNCKIALQALSDWAVTYAPDMGDPETVAKAKSRILEHGTLWYIANATDNLHAAILALSEAEKREREARAKALEESAQVAERDVDWSAFGKRDIQPWENGNDSDRDYRLGIATGRAIAASIRALQSEER